MLVSVELSHGRSGSGLVEPGIYISHSFSFGIFIEDEHDEYFGFETKNEYFGPYGVCDNIEQVKEKYSEWLNDPELKFCVSFTKVKKSDQPSEWGWRWHKWGEYIGNKNPQHEFLYDEGDDIQEIFCYHIYHIY